MTDPVSPLRITQRIPASASSICTAKLRLCETMSRRVKFVTAILLLAIAILGPWIVLYQSSFPINGPLRHEAYVWQRTWNEPVREAVSQHAKDFHQIVLLSAEVRWRNKEPQVVRVPIDYHAIRKTAMPVGLALRIGPYGGPFATTDKIAVFLSDLATALIAQARTNLVEVSELQIDFDCAESKLDGSRRSNTRLRPRPWQSLRCRVGLRRGRSPTWL
jgi:hypothetical protein